MGNSTDFNNQMCCTARIVLLMWIIFKKKKQCKKQVLCLGNMLLWKAEPFICICQGKEWEVNTKDSKIGSPEITNSIGIKHFRSYYFDSVTVVSEDPSLLLWNFIPSPMNVLHTISDAKRFSCVKYTWNYWTTVNGIKLFPCYNIHLQLLCKLWFYYWF